MKMKSSTDNARSRKQPRNIIGKSFPSCFASCTASDEARRLDLLTYLWACYRGLERRKVSTFAEIEQLNEIRSSPCRVEKVFEALNEGRANGNSSKSNSVFVGVAFNKTRK